MRSSRNISESKVISPVVARPPNPIYLDHNATTPLDPIVLESMMPFFTGAFGNAASKTHSYGHQAATAVEESRALVGELIHAEGKEIIWTSGATESNNLAIKGTVLASKNRAGHIIIQATEHNAVLDPCNWLESEGFKLTILPVDSCGRITAAQVQQAICPDTILVSIMWANNETGTIQPIREIGAVCRKANVLFHTDATQAVGKILVDVNASNVDLLSFSGHKIYGPKGCGVLYVRQRSPRIRLNPIFHGGGHERGLRSGTINVPGVVGTGVACRLCSLNMKSEASRLSSLRDTLEKEILSRLAGVHINGNTNERLPHTSHLTFEGIDAEGILVAMDDIALSTGSACTSASVKPSHVLAAMGMSESAIYGSVRFGLGRMTTPQEIAYVTDRVSQTVTTLRELRKFA